MALKIPVKAGDVSNLTDARFFASHEVDMLGFCFDPLSDNYISPTEALAIAGWISGPHIVAECNNQDEENILEIIAFMNVGIVQLHWDYPLPFLHSLQQRDLRIILDISTASPSAVLDVLQYDCVDFFLITEAQFDAIPLLQNEKSIVRIQSIDNCDKYPAIQLSGTKEEATGIKLYAFEGSVLDELAM